MKTTRTFETPLGPMHATAAVGAVTTLHFGAAADAGPTCGTLDRLRRQLADYFAGRRTSFDVPLQPAGTPFQRRVWDELCKIAHGETITYGTLAARVGDAKAARAVGAANGRNPIALVVPCHRVVAANGKLGGYSGGGEGVKRWLLDHEAALRNPTARSQRGPAS